MRFSICATLLTLIFSPLFGWHKNASWGEDDDRRMIQPVLTVDLDDDGLEEQIYLISNVFVGQADHGQQIAAHGDSP